MDPLTDGLLRLPRVHRGWRRALLLVREAGGRVGRVKLPGYLELALRLTADDTVSMTTRVPVAATGAGRSTASRCSGGAVEPSPASPEAKPSP